MTPVDSFLERDFNLVFKQKRDSTSLKKKLRVEISPPGKKVPQNNQNNVPSSEHFIVARIFYPLIILGKFIGISPLYIIRSQNDTVIQYDFKWISVPSIFSTIFILSNGMVLIFWICNVFLDVEGPFGIRIFLRIDENQFINDNLFKGSEVISIVNRLSKLLLPFGAWVLCALQSSDVPSYSLFLNDWSVFLRNYEASFRSYHTHKIYKTLRIRLLIFSAIWTSPIILLIIFLEPVNYFRKLPPVLGYAFGYAQILHVVGTRGLIYLRDMMLLRTLTTAYQEVLNGMKAEYGKCGKSITKAQVTAWVDLISFVRKQASRAESYLSLPNLWSIFEVFISLLLMSSMLAFLFMSNTLQGQDNVGDHFLSYTFMYTIFFTASLFWKTRLAEDISKAEDAIAEQVIEMDTRDDDFETRLEMKLICDIIYKDPIKIRVGNMLTLNKRLLLAFFSQLASYLVVILQFTKP